jgi:hypothetical protein
MAGELVNLNGAAGFVTVATGLSLTAGVQIQAHATNTIASLFTVPEEDYPTFDIQIQVTAGTPTENNFVEVSFRPKADGTNESPAPSGAYGPHYVGSVTLDNATGYYYSFKMSVEDKLGTLYLKSNEASTALTVSVAIRMSTATAAA